MTCIEEYYNKIMSGEIVACKRIKQVYTMLVDKLHNPEKYDPWVFDEELANRPIEFIETFCKQAQGELGGALKLELFQKAKHQAVFGFVHKETRFRQYQEVLDIRGRKNGKTTELAADETFMLVGDGEGSPECYIIATKLDQSKKGFNECYKMIQQSPDLNKHLKKRKSDIYCPFNYGSLQALASNSNGLDGLNSHMVTIDELAAIKNRDIYDLMKQSMSSRRQPLLDCITTNGFIRGSIFDSQYDYACGVLDGKIKDDRFIAFIYELDDKDEWDKEEMWIKANPGLGPIKKIEFLRDCVNKAKSDPAFKATVMVKDFNMKENSASAWLRWDELNNEAIFNLKEMGFRYGIGCFDLAETTDLASAKVLCMRRDDPKIYILQMYFIPQEKLNQEETNKEGDSVPYKLWEQQELIRVCPGNKVNKYHILEWFKEIRDLHDIYIPWIGYDPWHVDDSLLQAFKDEFGSESMISVRQGVYTLSFPMKELKADLIAHRIIYNNNPIDKWCLSNMEIKTDINNNIQPIKGTDNRKRIDGGVSLIIGYVVLLDKMSEYENMI
ncbi:terminase large subunit [Clostridium chromiireducens]|uniref:Terminase large subunit n=1 Tax=Clostridium chromiireducens TaxID=225345 RepID=A0A964RIF3_9CLOT|nr:terminase TerL endonuclease subunit [Clostridium chromiireducens]MVX62247.1 terminase large subunit [Clostridium chromiireducens]